MIAIRSRSRRLRTCDKGATAIEYGLIVSLIVIALISGLSALGGGAGGMWTKIHDNVMSAG